MVAFLIVPQWQGSGSSRALRLIDGADEIRGDLPVARTTTVVVPYEAGENQDTGVDRITSLCTIRDLVDDALASIDDTVVIVGGDCGIELAPISRAVRLGGGRTAVVWFDAHPDLNTPETSESHAFHGMILRTLLGDGAERLVPAIGSRVEPAMLVLAGTRAFDEAEAEYVDTNAIEVVDSIALADPLRVVEILEARGVESVYIHVDLDVLDPSEVEGISFPEPFGPSRTDLVAAIAALRERFTIVGAGITEFAPSSPDAASADMSTILRIIAALTGPRT